MFHRLKRLTHFRKKKFLGQYYQVFDDFYYIFDHEYLTLKLGYFLCLAVFIKSNLFSSSFFMIEIPISTQNIILYYFTNQS